MSFVSIALRLIGVLAAFVVYGQIGWLLASAWSKKEGGWDKIDTASAAVFWPFAALWSYLLRPVLSAILWMITAPQERIVARQKRRQLEEHEAHKQRMKREREAEEKRRAEAVKAKEPAKSPATEIAEINEDMQKLTVRKAELERHPDATRH